MKNANCNYNEILLHMPWENNITSAGKDVEWQLSGITSGRVNFYNNFQNVLGSIKLTYLSYGPIN